MISSELFEDYILSKAMPTCLPMLLDEQSLIDALPRGRFNKYIREWMNSSMDEKRECYLDRLSNLLKKSTQNELRKGRERDWRSGLIVDLPIIMISDQIKHTHTHTYDNPT